MANRTVEAILRLSSKLGNMDAFRQVASRMDTIDRKAKAFNRSQGLVAKGAREMHLALLRYAAPAAAAAAIGASVRDYAAVERRLTRTGLVLGATREQMRDLNGDIAKNAQAYALSADSVMDTVDAYAAAGASLADIRTDLPLLAKAQQALDATGSDTVATWDAARKSLNLTSKDAQRFFELVAAGGAAGKFEAKDMAAELPALLPVAARAGMDGTKGAGSLVGFLEVMADYAGSAGQAATATADLLEKINSPDVIRNFSKFNVDIVKGMESARRNGEDLFSALHRFLMQATGGDAKKLGFLFGDKEARAAAGVVLGKLDEIKRAQDEVAANAPKILDRNTAAVLSDTQAQLDRLGNSWGRFKKQVGAGIVDIGVGGALDWGSEEIEKGRAINKALDASGMTEWQKSWWRFASNFDPAARAAKEYEGGYRTADQKALEARAQEAGERRQYMEATLALPPPSARGRNGMPIHPPLPTPRPAPDREFAEGYDRYHSASPTLPPLRPFPAGQSPRDAERESMHELRSDPNGVAEAIDDALAQSARRAGQSIDDLAGGAGAGASALRSLFDAIDSAARRINAATAGIRVGSMAGSGVSASGRNVGRSGGDVTARPE